MATSQQKLFKFTVDGGMHLQVVVHGGLPVRIDLQIANAPASLLLHWGVLCSSNNRNWTVPSSPPPGSRTYKQQALQTPMKKAHGKLSCLTIEIYDSNVYAIEFVFKDEGTNRWFKLNGHNIHIDLKDNNRVVSQHVITSNTDLKKEGNYVDMNQQGKEFAKVDVNIKKAQNFNHNSQMKWEASFILNKYSDKDKEAESSLKRSPLLLALESYGGSNGSYLQKDIFNLGRNLLAVLVRSNGKQSKIILVTDITEPIVLHWGLSLNRDHEWLVPPLGVRPKPSSVVDGACETQFKKGFAGNASLQFLEIELGENNFIGLPFVIRANRNWIKNNGSDFYTRLKASERNMPQNFSMKRIAKWLLDAIAEKEKDAERSLMHRFNIALDLTERAQCEGKLGLAGILVWMRFMATRRLTWNKNYNVKPREISVAQNRFTNVLQSIYQKQPHNRELVRLIMSTVGRGGQGDVGQRIRDEILAIQQRNNCKGGMMEEWHQKLHNNTNPDDVIICQALLDYIKSNFNIDAYWKTLNQNGMTREQLASYDRPIISEPRFTSNQKDGLVRDLTEYLKILKAVHSGADLDSAIAICVGYDTQGCNNIGRLQVEPIRGLSSNLRRLLKTVQHHVFNNDIGPLLEVILESRLELRSVLLDSHERLKDLIFLDLALDSTMRTTMERGYEQLKNAPPLDIILAICLMLVNLALSSDDNEDLVYCAKDWKYSYALCKINNQQWALFAKAVLDRTELTLADRTYQYQETLQPTADYLGAMLRIDQIAIKTFTEEVIRAGSGASLSILLNHFNPILRNIANVGRWQIINPVEARGFVSVVNELHTIQSRVYQRPTILVANKVKGEDEIPDGVVALLTTDMPDVLSHVSVRARTCKICFATCFDKKIFNNIKANEGKAVLLRPVSSEMNYFKLDGTDIIQGMNAYPAATRIPKISLKKRMFAGKYAVFADEFNNELVGSKSCNIANLRKRVPPWIKVPTSVAIPFGVFDVVLKMQTNKDVAERISKMNDLVRTEDFGKLKDIQKAVLDLRSPIELANELRAKMHRANILWQGEGHEKKWQQAWMAIKKVWASKWNERAYLSTRKLALDHNDLSMAVLIQEIISADYAFVIHTTNPLSKDPTEIYAEVVKGLGETLVGAYPGRAMGFVTSKYALQSPKIISYPSKKVGLFIKKSIIFRSDSNAEDLEGYAGAGLYDSVPMEPEEKCLLDYSSDKLIVDKNFQISILSKIAKAGKIIEEIYNAPQDIEGVIKDGEIYIVQTRPQM